MYTTKQRHAAYKRGVIYFIVYSIILFIFTATFLSVKMLLYFPIGFALSGAVAILFMSIQHRIEKGSDPNVWILNILIEIVGYGLFTYALFQMIFRVWN